MSFTLVCRTKLGETPLEKVYQNVPQVMKVKLDEAVGSSGYVAYRGSINEHVELDFG